MKHEILVEDEVFQNIQNDLSSAIDAKKKRNFVSEDDYGRESCERKWVPIQRESCEKTCIHEPSRKYRGR